MKKKTIKVSVPVLLEAEGDVVRGSIETEDPERFRFEVHGGGDEDVVRAAEQDVRELLTLGARVVAKEGRPDLSASDRRGKKRRI